MINKSAFWPDRPNNLSSAAETRNSNQTNIRNYVKCRKIVPGQVEKKLLSSLSRRDASLVRDIVHLKLLMTVVSTPRRRSGRYRRDVLFFTEPIWLWHGADGDVFFFPLNPSSPPCTSTFISINSILCRDIRAYIDGRRHGKQEKKTRLILAFKFSLF